ncbi:MAG: hypothetical protein AAF413_04205 [Patescibacteria group bacterium]
MILLASRIVGLPIISTRSGARVATVSGVLINPHKLTVEGLWVHVGAKKDSQILLSRDIRELSPRGVVINDLSDIAEPENMPRLEELVNIAYEIPNKTITENKKKIGTAQDFVFSIKTYKLEQVIARPKLFGRIKNSQLTIHRSQIKSVNDKELVVELGPMTSRVTSEGTKGSRPKRAQSSAANASVIVE